MEKLFTCICGREFTNSQSFNGHKSHCKFHQFQKYGNLDNLLETELKRLKSRVKTAQVNREKRIASQKIDDNLKINKWVSEEHRCEKCGKIMTDKYGSGRFCSRACANSRVHSKETKKKIAKSLMRDDKFRDEIYEDKFCALCGKQLLKYNKSGYCLDCIRHAPELKTYRSNISKHASACTKRHVTWLSRDKVSYPEKFWINVLNNNNILYEHNYMVPIDNSHRYFLDFYIKKHNTKVDLEIDGKQHKYTDRILHDTKRDKLLKALGYEVYRIEWNEINSQQGKDLMKNKINSFLLFYNNL